MNVMPDKFIFTKTGTSKDWFTQYEIPYQNIKDISIEKRTITNAEMLLSGGNDPNQQQENNICITFESTDNLELVLRVEMLTGITIYGQATKCREFMDILRQNDILSTFRNNKENTQNTNQPDMLEQIKKLSEMKDMGIISESEFETKNPICFPDFNISPIKNKCGCHLFF